MSLNHLVGATTPLTDVKVHNLTVLDTLVAGTISVGGFSPNSAVLTDGSGDLITGLLSLLTQTTDTLTVARGGTGSATALSNGLLMQSLGGKIVESSIMPSQVALLPVDLGTQVTGLLKISNGGTNSNTPLANGFIMQSSGGKIVESSVLISSIPVLPITLETQTTGLLGIDQGGTNSSTALTNNRLIWSAGGSIVEAKALTNGQMFIGSTGSAPVPAIIAGTANQISVVTGAGSLQLSTPQDIGTGSSVTFAGLTLTTLSAFTTPSQTLTLDGSNVVRKTSTVTTGTANTIALRGTSGELTGAFLNLSNTSLQINLGDLGAQYTTINAPPPASTQIIRIIDSGKSNADFVLTEANQTINGNKTLSGTTNLSGVTASQLLATDASKNIVALTSSSNPVFTSITGYPKNQVYAWAHIGANFSFPNASTIIVGVPTTPWVVDISSGITVDTTQATGAFTLPVAGWYIFEGQIYTTANTSQLAFILYFLSSQDSSTKRYGNQTFGPGRAFNTTAVIYTDSPNQTVTFQVTNNTSATVTAQGGDATNPIMVRCALITAI